MARWTLVTYKAPSQPSSARVAAWRRLNRLGALYLGPGVCLVPDHPNTGRSLEWIAAGLTVVGGSFDTYAIEVADVDSQASLISRYNHLRDQEYVELIERSDAMLEELDREARGGKFSFAEVEENDADLSKLRRWLRRVQWRDRFGADRRQEAEAAVDRAARGLDDYVRTTLHHQQDPDATTCNHERAESGEESATEGRTDA